MDVGDGDSNYQ